MTAFDHLCLRLGRVAILVVVLAAPFLLAEVLARLVHEPSPVRRVYDPFAYRITRPFLEEELVGRDGDRFRIRFNELGMRGPSITESVSPDTLTLVFLGGSTTENYALALDATFPELTGTHLETRTGRSVRVFNAGMSAATTSSNLGRLQHQVLELEPSLVIVMHAINDLMTGFHPEYRSDGRFLRRPALAGALPRSYLYDWLRRRRPIRLSRERRRVAEFASLPVFERNLLSMAGIARAHGIPILFLTQAHRFRADLSAEDQESMRIADSFGGLIREPPDFESLARGMRTFNSVTLAIPTESGTHVFDLAASLPPERHLIYDECHLTRAGNLRVAEILGPVIEQILESEPSEAASETPLLLQRRAEASR